MLKSLDQKLAAIHADPHGCRAFILADAKDADMAFGIGAPGESPERHNQGLRFRTLAEYREQIRQVIEQGLVDIMLMSASTNDVLTIQERLFENSAITPAGRANDASDVFVVRGGKYLDQPAQPFRSAALDHLQCGHLDCLPQERVRGANLGLYSVTFNNRLDHDLRTLNEYKAFREEAERKGFRHFLEVFDPNTPHDLSHGEIPNFINDHIARTLAGVAPAGRPIFLKIVYHGPRAMEDLVAYDPHLVVGILGGAAGTTYDAFKLLAEAKKYGARAALYGRKINSAENQLAFIEFLNLLRLDLITPEEAVRAYHAVLAKLGVKPHCTLAQDMELRTNVMSYSGKPMASVPTLPLTMSKSIKSSHEHETSHGDCGCGGHEPAACACPTKAAVVEPQCPCGGHSKSECECDSHDDHGHGHANHGHQDDITTAKPDFKRMTAAEKLAWNQAKRDNLWGRF